MKATCFHEFVLTFYQRLVTMRHRDLAQRVITFWRLVQNGGTVPFVLWRERIADRLQGEEQ